MWKELSNYGMKLHLQKEAIPKIILGFDIGTSCTGVSISSGDLKTAYVNKNIKKYLSSIRKGLKS